MTVRSTTWKIGRRCALVAALMLVMVGCTSAPPAEVEMRTASPSPSPTLEPDPEPEVSASPAQVRFAGRIRPLPLSLQREMRGTTWRPECPVPLEDLRLLRFNHWGFDGEIKRGPMVVHRDVAEDVLWAFRQLFEAGFPIKRVGLAREYVPERFEPEYSSRRSVTAGFNCRPVLTPRGPGSSFSRHAYGLAIDINPLQNPYVTADGFVRNREARRYVDRSRRLQGMIHDGDVVVRAFAEIGWTWGGRWSGDKDYMHFAR
jgi:hypothetical protein